MLRNAANQNTETLYSGRWLKVLKADEQEFVVCKHSKSVVSIIAITRIDRLLLTEQYRPSMGASVLELPAGIVGDEPDKKHETEEAAARRELLEETGYEALRIEHVLTGPISAGISNEIVSFYYSDDIIQRTDGGGNGKEDIRVHAVFLPEVDDYLARLQERGVFIDPKIHIGLRFVQQRRKIRAHVSHVEMADAMKFPVYY